MKKILLLTIGLLAFALGTVGLYLPFLPTTVFYMIATYCLARSSDKFYTKLTGSKHYEEYIVKPFIHGQVSNRKKSHIFLSLTIVFGISILLAPPIWVKWMLGGIYLAHIIGLSWYWAFKAKKQ